VYEPVSLTQDFRSFDFMSPWEGAQYILPGGQPDDDDGGDEGKKL
jgi:NADH-quinone oxidoreductase subunit C